MKNTGARKVFERLVAIAVELTTPEGVNVPQIAARFEVSTKTIQRDLDFMRDYLLLDIRYERQARCRGVWLPSKWTTQQVERVKGIGAVFANLQ